MDDQQPAEALADKIAARFAEWMEGSADSNPTPNEVASQLRQQSLERLREISELVAEVKKELEEQPHQPPEDTPGHPPDPHAIARQWIEAEGHLDKAIAELEAARKSVSQHTHRSTNPGGNVS